MATTYEASMAALQQDPTGASLGLSLPAGRVLDVVEGPPVLWRSDAPPEPELLAELHARVGETGLWPVLMNGEGIADPLRPRRSEPSLDALPVLADWARERLESLRGRGLRDDLWPVVSEAEVFAHATDEAALADWQVRYRQRGEIHDPRECPACEAMCDWLGSGDGADFARHADRDPGLTAAAVTRHYALQEPERLGLVACELSADIPAVLGWDGPVNYCADRARISAVLRRWEERFGMRVVSLQGASLSCSVAAPPRTYGQAIELAAEQTLFCPDLSGTFHAPSGHAAALTGSSVWSFWWD